MKRIKANLPSLGAYEVRFHNESAVLLNWMSEKELARLDRVPHLGVAACAFTGINHSRQEYMLLQCAVSDLLPKFHKGKEALSLSAKIKLSRTTTISSGQEMLKCWSLLGGIGHTQYTYGTERALLTFSRENASFYRILTRNLPPKLKAWARGVVEGYRDQEFHYLLAAFRVSKLPRKSPIRAVVYRSIEALVLPLEQISEAGSGLRYKIYRLREIFARVRLLSMVSLDAYYSHHPLRYQISMAIMNLDGLLKDVDEHTDFHGLLESTAAWLADEIYIHPDVVAIQSHYEIMAREKIDRKLGSGALLEEKVHAYFVSLLNEGFGKPRRGVFLPFLRMTFEDGKFGQVFNKDVKTIARLIEAEIASEGLSVYVTRNPFSQRLHIDMMSVEEHFSLKSISEVMPKLFSWLIRLVEAQVLWRYRRFLPSLGGTVTERDALLLTRFRHQVFRPSARILTDILWAVLRRMLPSDYSFGVSEFIAEEGRLPVLWRLRWLDGEVFDELTPGLDHILKENPSNRSDDYLQEVRAVREVVGRSGADYIVACIDKFVIRDRDHQMVREWDGIVLEVFNDRVKLSVIEAKNGKGKAARVRAAMEQLERTVELLNLPP